MFSASLRVDIEFFFMNKKYLLRAGDLIKVDVMDGIAVHGEDGINFDIDPLEYSLIN